MMSRQMYSRIATTKDQYGRYLLSTSNGGIADGRPETLCGFQIGGDDEATRFDENLPTDPDAANVISVALGDWRQAYVIVDRIGIRILRDPYTAKPYILFYTTKRLSGGVMSFDDYTHLGQIDWHLKQILAEIRNEPQR
jgi:HK97 family phage major capsid protein